MGSSPSFKANFEVFQVKIGRVPQTQAYEFSHLSYLEEELGVGGLKGIPLSPSIKDAADPSTLFTCSCITVIPRICFWRW
jgi:hypothetical protein